MYLDRMFSTNTYSMFDFDHNMNESSSLGLNKHVQKKFKDIDAVDNISEYIDLGLPSGNLWCKHNHGAASEEEIGEYYSFDDAQKLDAVVPSKDDFNELRKYCKEKLVNIKGVDGLLFTSKKNGNSVFFPMTGYYVSSLGQIKSDTVGYYWTSSKKTNQDRFYLAFSKSLLSDIWYTRPYAMLPVRSIKRLVEESSLGLNKHVQKKFEDIDAIDNISEYVDLGLPSGTLWRKHNYGTDEEYGCGEYCNFKEANELEIQIPAPKDFLELDKYCNHEWVLNGGINGILFTSNINGGKLFLPASGYRNSRNVDTIYNLDRSGYYWSSETYSSIYGHNLLFNKSTLQSGDFSFIHMLFSVRPVKKVMKESGLGLNKRVQKKFEENEENNIEDIAAITHETIESIIVETLDKHKVQNLDSVLASLPIENNKENTSLFKNFKSGNHYVDKMSYVFWKPDEKTLGMEGITPFMVLDIVWAWKDNDPITTIGFPRILVRCWRKEMVVYLNFGKDCNETDTAKMLRMNLFLLDSIIKNQKQISDKLTEFYKKTSKQEGVPDLFKKTNVMIEYQSEYDGLYKFTDDWEKYMRELLGQFGTTISSTCINNS